MENSPIFDALILWTIIGGIVGLFINCGDYNNSQKTFLFSLCGPLTFIIWIGFYIYIRLEDDPRD